MEHGLYDGRVTDPTGKIDRKISEARNILEQLMDDVCEKFGVVLPQDYPKGRIGQTLPPAPEGKVYFLDWYKRIEKDCNQ